MQEDTLRMEGIYFLLLGFRLPSYTARILCIKDAVKVPGPY